MSPKTKIQNSQIRQKTKEKIISAALQLFSEKGYAYSSIRMIAKTAQISDGLLYSYFKSKDELAIEVLKSAFEKLDLTIIDAADHSPVQNVEQSIKGFISLLKNELSKIRLLAQMGIHKEKIELLNKATISKYEQSVEKFKNNFEQMGITNALTEARFLVAILDGIMFETLLMNEPFDIHQIETDLIKKYCK